MRRLITAFPPLRKINSALFHFRRNQWRWNPRFRDASSTIIDRPIYLLGTQGGGLTLLSRILHRHPHAISVTGDCNYWAGDDETQNVLRDALPEQFSWRDVSLPRYNAGDHNWLYANDDFLPYYRDNGESTEAATIAAYRAVLRKIIRMNWKRSDRSARFIDKSQSLTVRVGLVRKTLTEFRPRFVMLTRDPFAMTWRAVTKDRVVSGLQLSEREKFEVAVQHWTNSMRSALEDAHGHDDFACWRFEDLLAEPVAIVRQICAHAELEFRHDILPGPDDDFPWGSAFDAFSRRKWYPLRADVSSSYLRSMPAWAMDHLLEHGADLIERFGYAPPQ